MKRIRFYISAVLMFCSANIFSQNDFIPNQPIGKGNTYETDDRDNDIDQSPQATRSLIRQLTGPAGVAEEDIIIYDASIGWKKRAIRNCDNYLKEVAKGYNNEFGVYRPNGVETGSLGVFEHRNSPQRKQYSRNLGKNEGIELYIVENTTNQSSFQKSENRQDKIADKPLYRDPKYDGAADPIVIWDKKGKKWLMFYTNRRANLKETKGVDWVHGTPIGIAESLDGGSTWQYKCDANIAYGKDKQYTYWAPDIVEEGGLYHMFLTVVPGIFTDWDHEREIVHLESYNLIDWTFVNKCNLVADRVIDAGMFKMKNGKWRMYYNNERDNKSIYFSETDDFIHWNNYGKVISDRAGEGPKVFYWKDKYFMIVDNWDGLGVYSSPDMEQWTRQKNNILRESGAGKDDETKGLHADVIINNDRAYIFYFTHPERSDSSKNGYGDRRTSIQVAELEYIDNEIICNRDNPVYINLKTK